jgi:uncharacterized membrane protein
VIVDAPASSFGVSLALLNGLPHAAANIFLLWFFARTLAPGREALITGFARRFHGSLPPYIASYSRGVTWAWCFFFGAQVLVSAVLFTVASLETWSLFVNVVSFPLVAVMFVAEYLFRIARFPDYPHASIWEGIRAFARPDPTPRSTESPSRN